MYSNTRRTLQTRFAVAVPASKSTPRSVPRGIVNDQEPKPPAGLSPSESYRWITGRRHLTTAYQVDINALDDAERTRHFARLRSTIDDLLRLCGDLSKERDLRPPAPPFDVF